MTPPKLPIRPILSVQHYPVFGGPTSEIVRLEPLLNDHGYRTVVALPDSGGSAECHLREAGIDVRTLPLSRFRARDTVWGFTKALARIAVDARAIRRIAEDVGAEIIKVHGLQNPHGALAAKMDSRPVLWVLSGNALPRPYRRLGMAYARRWASAFLVNGESLIPEFPGLSTLEHVYPYLPAVGNEFGGISHDAGRANLLSEVAIPDTDPIIGTVANVNPAKGLEYLVAALDTLRQRGNRSHLVILGERHAAQEAYIARLDRDIRDRRLGHNVHFLGFRRDVGRLLPGFDVMAISSVHEGTTTTAGEAMRSGVPVVATDVGAVRDVVQHGRTGFLVPPRNPVALADGLDSVLTDHELRERLVRRGHQFSRLNLTLEALASSYVQAFEASLSPR